MTAAIEHLPRNTMIVRKGDMAPRARLRLIIQEDGDICVAVVDDDGNQASVEFCSAFAGGGKSPRTLKALCDLAAAILQDNEEEPSRAAQR